MPNYVDVGLSARIDASPPDPNNPRQMPDDRYPLVIQDARHGYGCETVEEIRAYQAGWCAGECPPHDRPPPKWPVVAPRPDPELRETVPYINASRWIADCPQCGTANWVWDRLPDMVCLGRGCGLTFKVLWQLPTVRSEVIRVIAGWPEQNRSWDAHKGETVEELKIQGVLMLGVEPVKRNGLLVAENLHMPDDVLGPQEYLDRLRSARVKAAKGLR